MYRDISIKNLSAALAVAALLPAGAIAQGAATTTDTEAQSDPAQPDPAQTDVMQDDAASPLPADQPEAELPAGEEAMPQDTDPDAPAPDEGEQAGDPQDDAAPQGTTDAEPADADAPQPTAMLSNGTGEAVLHNVMRQGDRLQVTVRFQLDGSVRRATTLYGNMSRNNWEQDFYMTAGDQKYLILRDSSQNVLASRGVTLEPDTPVSGSWTATFPAPSAGEEAMLYLLDVEPIGPFTIPE